MRLTIMASAILLALTGCSTNVSDTHMAPTMVSTAPAAKPQATTGVFAGSGTTPTLAQSASGKGTSSYDSSVTAVASSGAGTGVKASSNTTATTDSVFTGINDVPATTLTASSDTPTTPAPQLQVVPTQAAVKSVVPVTTSSNTSASKATPGSAPDELSKQVAPRWEYLRVIHQIPGRLYFDAASRQFVFTVNAGTLKDNVNDLLAATAEGSLEYTVDENLRFPNTFSIRGQTVTHLIDKMVGPFKSPGQVWQNVHVNNLVVISYSQRMASNAG